ncbi:MAG: hypothetical protein OXI50_09570 [Gammaproteobacteria bacterium]|nr:hypothetical protein [Gammaproteobacteria bacterium]
MRSTLTLLLSLAIAAACGEPGPRTAELALAAAAPAEYAAWQTARGALDVAEREAGQEAIAARRQAMADADAAVAEATARRDATLAAVRTRAEREAAQAEWVTARDAALAIYQAAGIPSVLVFEEARSVEAAAMQRLAAAAPDAWIEFAATTDHWLRDVDTSTMPGLLLVLDDDSIGRVTAILQDELDPAWREQAASGELTDDPEALAFWRRLARIDVSAPLTDAEKAYLEHRRAGVRAFGEDLLSNDPELRKLLGLGPGEGRR